MDTIDIFAGDTLPGVTGKITEDDGVAPVDITGWAITLHIDYDQPLIKVAHIPVGTDGVFQFAWAVGDLKVGSWPAELQFDSPSGVQTVQRTDRGRRLRLVVYPDIA